MNIKKTYRIWKSLARASIISYLSTPIDITAYFIGKAIRFAFFLIFILSIYKYRNAFAGLSTEQFAMIFIFFNIMDTLGQAFMRGAYDFPVQIKKGLFDNRLTKPYNPMLFSTFKQVDILDVLFLLPLIGLFIHYSMLIAVPSIFQVVQSVLLFVCGIISMIALHIISTALVLRIEENNNIIWIYREASAMGRFPKTIFPGWMQFSFTFLIPIFIMSYYPARALLQPLSLSYMMLLIFTSLAFMTISILLWHSSLRKYQSASS